MRITQAVNSYLVSIATSKLDIKYACVRIAVFCGERSGAKIRSFLEGWCSKLTQALRLCPRWRPVIRIRYWYTFQSPQHPGRRISPYDNIIARIIGNIHTGKIGGHSGGVIATTGVTCHLLQGEHARTYRGHIII